MPTPLHKKVEEIFEVLDEVREANVIGDWDHGFIQNQAERVDKYGARTKFSDKTTVQIDRIYEAVCKWDEPTRRTR